MVLLPAKKKNAHTSKSVSSARQILVSPCENHCTPPCQHWYLHWKYAMMMSSSVSVPKYTKCYEKVTSKENLRRIQRRRRATSPTTSEVSTTSSAASNGIGMPRMSRSKSQPTDWASCLFCKKPTHKKLSLWWLPVHSKWVKPSWLLQSVKVMKTCSFNTMTLLNKYKSLLKAHGESAEAYTSQRLKIDCRTILGTVLFSTRLLVI